MYNRILSIDDINQMNLFIRERKYDINYSHHLWYKEDAILKWSSILKTIEHLNIQNSTIIDIGCGDSKPPIILKDLGNKVIGFDIDTRANNIEGVEIKIGDALDLLNDIEDNSIDVIYDSCSVTHFYTNSEEEIPNIGWDKISKEVYRVLKPGGYFIVASDCRIQDSFGEFISPKQIVNIIQNNGLNLTSDFINSEISDNLYRFDYGGYMYIVSLSFKK